jgi:hypothetical protein
MSELRQLLLSLVAAMVALLPIASSVYLSGADAVYDLASYLQYWFS